MEHIQNIKDSREALILFEELKAVGLFAEAQVMFELHRLSDHAQPIMQQQISGQRQHATGHFLQLPLPLDRVCLVCDLATLEQVEAHFSRLQSPGGCNVVVAVDAEWREGANVTGASILQIATNSHVFIVDFLADWSDPVARNRLKDFLSAVFGRRDIIKVGWDFGKADMQQLRATADGFFADCFDSRSVVSVLDLPRMIETLFNANLLPTVKSGLEMGKKHGTCAWYFYVFVVLVIIFFFFFF